MDFPNIIPKFLRKALKRPKNIAFVLFCLLFIQTVSWLKYLELQNEREMISQERSKLLIEMSTIADQTRKLSNQRTQFLSEQMTVTKSRVDSITPLLEETYFLTLKNFFQDSTLSRILPDSAKIQIYDNLINILVHHQG